MSARRPMRTLRPGEINVEDVTGEHDADAPQLDPSIAKWFAVADHVMSRVPTAASKVAAVPASWLTIGIVALAFGILGGLGGGKVMVAWHSNTDSDRIIHRIERLEAGMLAADEHNAWVQAALVALSEDKPLPPPPYRRIAPHD